MTTRKQVAAAALKPLLYRVTYLTREGKEETIEVSAGSLDLFADLTDDPPTSSQQLYVTVNLLWGVSHLRRLHPLVRLERLDE